MVSDRPSSNVGLPAAIVWGWIVMLAALLAGEAFSFGFQQGWSALTKSPAMPIVFFCLPLLAFAASVPLAVRMSRGDRRDRPLAIALPVVGLPWALAQSFAVLPGL